MYYHLSLQTAFVSIRHTDWRCDRHKDFLWRHDEDEIISAYNHALKIHANKQVAQYRYCLVDTMAAYLSNSGTSATWENMAEVK